MNAEIICVGTELLLGNITNTNAVYISQQLALCGINCFYQTVVGDNPERLRECVMTSLSRSDIIITTGGLGPTYDDVTKETISSYFGINLYEDEKTVKRIKHTCKTLGLTFTENNLKQAYIPEGATILENDKGSAPGIIMKKGKKTAILLPGPHKEMVWMFDSKVKPYLRGLSDHVIVSRDLHLFGISESEVEHILNTYMLTNDNPTIAPYAKEWEVILRLTAKLRKEDDANMLLDPAQKLITDQLGSYIYGIDVKTLENALVQELLKRGLTMAVVECGTGGLTYKRISAVRESYRILNTSIATPSIKDNMGSLLCIDECKMKSPQELSRVLAEQVSSISNASIGLSVIVNSEKASDDTKYGDAYIAVSYKDQEVINKMVSLSFDYSDERDQIMNSAASHAIFTTLSKLRE